MASKSTSCSLLGPVSAYRRSNPAQQLTFTAPPGWTSDFFEAEVRNTLAPYRVSSGLQWKRLKQFIVPLATPIKMEVFRENIGDATKPSYQAKITFLFASDWEGRAFHLIYYNSPYFRRNSDQSVDDRANCFTAAIPPVSLNTSAMTESELTEIIELFIRELACIYGRETVDDLLDTEWLKVDSYFFETKRIFLPSKERPLDELDPLFNPKGSIDWIKFSRCLIPIPRPTQFEFRSRGKNSFIQFSFKRSEEAGIFFRLAALKSWFSPLTPIWESGRVKFSAEKTDISPYWVYDQIEALFGREAFREFLKAPLSLPDPREPARDDRSQPL